jgi:hypothetical protein
LPTVTQYQIPIVWSDANSTGAASNYYLLAEASITASKNPGVDCTVSPSSSVSRYATYTTQASLLEVADD